MSKTNRCYKGESGITKMPARTLMIQGTASSVGKSIMVTALCRILHQDGFRAAPFKAQNMALNSYVTRDGGEIGRAQAVQAEAAGIEPTIDMNPVLLKPEADDRCQVIVLGKVVHNLKAEDYYQYTPHLLKIVEDSLSRLRVDYDIVVMEGAGSPAEINLKKRDIVNMRLARRVSAPVLLVGDIDRGGVFASLVGTLRLLTPRERGLVKGLIINKFRGDPKLLKPGLELLEKHTAKPVLGVIPYFRNITIAQEDSVYLEERNQQSSAKDALNIAIIRLPHISNYDDFDPLETEGCQVNYIVSLSQLNNPDLIILPGTKNTIADLTFLRESGLARAILNYIKARTPVIGICGGYQMLGKSIADPYHVESKTEIAPGLGILNVDTVFSRNKRTVQVKARVLGDSGLFSGLRGIEVSGYEIHMGQTIGQDCSPAFQVFETPQGKVDYFDGAIDRGGWVLGSYLHGLFHNANFTQRFLNRLREWRQLPQKLKGAFVHPDEEYNKLAQIVRENIDLPRIYNIIFGGS